MSRKLAIKRLPPSDLIFFKYHFDQQRGRSRQKCITLDTEVFIARFYPHLSSRCEGIGFRCFDPSGVLITKDHSISKGKSKKSKNWRLNAKFAPVEMISDHIKLLGADDFAVLEFIGVERPEGVRAAFFSSRDPSDSALYTHFAGMLSIDRAHLKHNQSMISLSEGELIQAVMAFCPNADHPLYRLCFDDQLEAIAADPELAGAVAKLPAGVTPPNAEQIERIRLQQSKVGRQGELLVHCHLTELKREGRIAGHDWVSRRVPYASHDFRLTEAAGDVFVEVKSTSAEFSQRVYISRYQLAEAIRHPERTDLYRVFEVDEAGGKLRTAIDVREIARRLLAAISDLPFGIEVDRFSIPPDALRFTSEVTPLEFCDEEDLR